MYLRVVGCGKIGSARLGNEADPVSLCDASFVICTRGFCYHQLLMMIKLTKMKPNAQTL